MYYVNRIIEDFISAGGLMCTIQMYCAHHRQAYLGAESTLPNLKCLYIISFFEFFFLIFFIFGSALNSLLLVVASCHDKCVFPGIPRSLRSVTDMCCCGFCRVCWGMSVELLVTVTDLSSLTIAGNSFENVFLDCEDFIFSFFILPVVLFEI